MFVVAISAGHGRVCYVHHFSHFVGNGRIGPDLVRKMTRRTAAARHLHLLDALLPLAALRPDALADLRGSASGTCCDSLDVIAHLPTRLCPPSSSCSSRSEDRSARGLPDVRVSGTPIGTATVS